MVWQAVGFAERLLAGALRIEFLDVLSEFFGDGGICLDAETAPDLVGLGLLQIIGLRARRAPPFRPRGRWVRWCFPNARHGPIRRPIS